MNEEEIAHLLDDKNSKNTKKNRKRQVACALFETSPHAKGI